MSTNLTIDKAGRVVIPKPVRDALQLRAGDELELGVEEDQIHLKPIRERATMRKEKGIWVFRTGKPMVDISIPDLIDQMREERSRDILG